MRDRLKSDFARFIARLAQLALKKGVLRNPKRLAAVQAPDMTDRTLPHRFGGTAIAAVLALELAPGFDWREQARGARPQEAVSA